MNVKLKKILALTLSLVMACSLCLTACGGQEEPPASTESGAVNVNYGISNPWDSLMPYYSVSGSNYSRIIYDKIYDRLAYVQADGTCLPRGADSWESADNGYAILFQLNEKAAFHDGTPVTAQHWADTLTLVTDPACEVFGRTFLSGLAGTDDTGAAVAGEKLGVDVVEYPMLENGGEYARHSTERLADILMELYEERAQTKIFD